MVWRAAGLAYRAAPWRVTVDEILTKPSVDDIRRAGADFDSENEVLEEALGELFRQYPHNTLPAQVLLKVTALNAMYSTQIPLYSTRIPTLFELVDHIVALDIDSRLERGDEGLVFDIAKIEVPPKAIRFNYSFATKYCSWHNRNAYPIFDSRVYEYLCHAVNHGFLDSFRQKDLWVYSRRATPTRPSPAQKQLQGTVVSLSADQVFSTSATRLKAFCPARPLTNNADGRKARRQLPRLRHRPQ
jgi:hypothetical protein